MNKKHFILSTLFLLVLASCNQNNTSPTTSNTTYLPTTSNVENTTSEYNSSSNTTTLPITKYRLNLDLDDGVSISSVDQMYEENSVVSFEITSSPTIGSYYSVYFNESELVANENIYSFVMPNHDSTLKIEIEKLYFDVVVVPNENASIEIIDNITSACYNDIISFTIDLETGYSLTKLNICPKGTNLPILYTYENGVYSFIMPASNVEISVELNYAYSININSPYIPVAIADNITSAFEGYEVLFTLGEPSDKSWALKNVEIITSKNEVVEFSLNNGVYSFIMPNDDVTIKVYTSKLYAIKDLSDENSSINIMPSKEYYSFNEEISVEVTINSGYELEEITIKRDGDEEQIDVSFQVVDNVYSFLMPSSDVYIVVLTKEKVISSFDPWPSKTTYSGFYDYDIYRCYIYVTFNGDGTLTWYLKYDEYDEWYCEWYGPYDFKKCNGNVAYTFDALTNTVTFTSNKAGSSVEQEFHIKVTFSGETPVSISFEENLGVDNRAKTKGVVLN